MNVTTIAYIGGQAMPATLSYDPRDPYAVRMTCADVEWIFGRDLIAQALQFPSNWTGSGDVRIKAVGWRVNIDLHGLDESACVSLPMRDVQTFIALSVSIVPLGEESRMFDWDRELALLLG